MNTVQAVNKITVVKGVNINLMTFSQVLGSKAVEWQNKKDFLK